MRADLHVHSKYSTRPSHWVLQKINCPECFTEPKRLYDIAKSKGMSLVTITDHNAIEGALELAGLPDTFISEEITTYFPEDRCKIHILAYDITEIHHKEIQRIRHSIFDLADYLREEKIVHVVAHPLYSINDRLTVKHFQQLLLLFKNFELNGARDETQNAAMGSILSRLMPAHIERWANDHGIEPAFDEPWIKNLTGGSDDHSSLNIARRYTEVEDARDVSGFLKGINDGRARVHGCDSHPQTLAHNLYAIAYQFYKERFNLSRHVRKDAFLGLLDKFLGGSGDRVGNLWDRLYHRWHYRKRPRSSGASGKTMEDLFRHESQALIWEDPELMSIVKNGNSGIKDVENKWLECVDKVSNKVLLHFGQNLFGHLAGIKFFNFFSSLGSAGALYAVLSPYFVSFSVYAKDRRTAQVITEALLSDRTQKEKKERVPHVAHFTDTLYEVNGVALTLQQQIQRSSATGKKLTVITCDDSGRTNGGAVRNFVPVGVSELPVYHEQKLFYPPFLEMLRYCYEKGFTHIHSATPGPIGLAALAIARILRVPIFGTYHTALPQYAGYLTEDDTIEGVTWKYVLWYYDQMDTVFVPSRATRKELQNRGIRRDKIRLFPRGVDIERFHPSKADPHVEERYGLSVHPRLLYVGRVSKEKNLQLLTRVYKRHISKIFDASLTIVGEGPYLEEMRKELRDTKAVFTGYVEGEELAALYASCDLFVFPSTTDTFGNVVLEAQASGLPVVVTDAGGPQENVISGKTGLVVPADDEKALGKAIESLLLDSNRLAGMAEEARRYMEERAFDKAFDETWKIYQEEAPGNGTAEGLVGLGPEKREGVNAVRSWRKILAETNPAAYAHQRSDRRDSISSH
jgi:glycosyltransferase involved in cell wall biosynthesis